MQDRNSVDTSIAKRKGPNIKLHQKTKDKREKINNVHYLILLGV